MTPWLFIQLRHRVNILICPKKIGIPISLGSTLGLEDECLFLKWQQTETWLLLMAWLLSKPKKQTVMRIWPQNPELSATNGRWKWFVFIIKQVLSQRSLSSQWSGGNRQWHNTAALHWVNSRPFTSFHLSFCHSPSSPAGGLFLLQCWVSTVIPVLSLIFPRGKWLWKATSLGFAMADTLPLCRNATLIFAVDIEVEMQADRDGVMFLQLLQSVINLE